MDENWHSTKEDRPANNCDVLICIVYNQGTYHERKFYDVVGYHTDLYELDKCDFVELKYEKDRSGFYKLDPEWGFVHVFPDAWKYISEYNYNDK